MRLSLSLFGFLLLANSLFAADGVLEINQACALNGGCFSGDSAGFPVTIDGSAGKSYRLTGDLDSSSVPNAAAIEVSGSFVTLDLGGFEISGATECWSPGGMGWVCDPDIDGAHGVGLDGAIESATIQNGTIRNMAGDGIGGANALMTIVENVSTSENAGWGMLLGDQSLIKSSRAKFNGDGGFRVMNYSVISQSFANRNDGKGFQTALRSIVSSCTAIDNADRAFDLGAVSKFQDNTAQWIAGTNLPRCGGGLCTEHKRFYLTSDLVPASSALTACTGGFHMAALTEIFDLGDLQYDTVLGFASTDSGSGNPTSAWGWVRTGIGSDTNLNCAVWTSDSAEDRGSVTMWNAPAFWSDMPEYIAPWRLQTFACDADFSVWCVED